MTKRADCHRVGAIVPEDYDLVLCYSLSSSQDGVRIPALNVNCEIEKRDRETGESGKHAAGGHCCVLALRTIATVAFSAFGDTGKCSICGAAFIRGDVWRHKSGEYIHVGHTCADKYDLLADTTDFDARLDSLKRRTAAARIAEQSATERAEFLATVPGLEDALKADHPIVKDMAAKLKQWRSLSDKQVALVFKLAHEVANPKPAEQHVPAPEGRVTVRGVVVSAKAQEGYHGQPEVKMTVKVITDAGSWLAWGTMPQCLHDAVWEQTEGFQPKFAGECTGDKLRGQTVEFTATLSRGRDPHFALFKRPSKARIVQQEAA